MTRKEFKKLPLGKKVDYVFWQSLAAVFALSLLFSFVQKEFKINQPALKVEMIDACQEVSDEPAFSPFFTENGLSGDPSSYQIRKRIQLGTLDQPPVCSPQQLLFCSVNAYYDTDLYFWNSMNVQHSLSRKSLMDLRDFMSPEILRQFQDQLIYTAPLLKGGYPCAISLKDNQWLQENQYYPECAVGIARTASNPETAAQFLSYILQ